MKILNTNTKFLGIDIASPIIVGSCGLTTSLSNLEKLEKAGAGAIILKSIFEEQIIFDIRKNATFISTSNYGESYDYIAEHVADNAMSNYFSLIREAKQKLSIPIIGSVNCISFNNWISYAKRFQDEGCDALELNFMVLPSDVNMSYDDVERLFFETILALKRTITIPILIKVGKYFTDMAKFMQKLSWAGINGITLFNKTIHFDIDIQQEETKNTSILSAPQDMYETLRWVAILSSKIRCEISASTGIYSGEDAIKMLLAGAQTVQVVSTLYKNGIEHIEMMNNTLKNWMEQKGYHCIEDFRGKMAAEGDHSAFTRTQFMKHFSEIE